MGDYQTLNEFMRLPFYKRVDDFKVRNMDKKYENFIQTNNITVKSCCEVEDSFYFHILIPSESNKGKLNYDVVLKFFTNNKEVEIDSNLNRYTLQFFSNSPSFIYNYAYLYKREGYLINILYDKLGTSINTPPTVNNINMDIIYDKSIYFACKFILNNRKKYLNKKGWISLNKKDVNKFFKDISDFTSIRLDQDIINMEKQINKTEKKKSTNEGKKLPKQEDRKIRIIVGKDKIKASKNKVVKKSGRKMTFKR